MLSLIMCLAPVGVTPLHYRVASQAVYATVLGMREVFTRQGITFASQQKNPNEVLWVIALYMIEYLRLQNDVFKLGRETKISTFERKFTELNVLLTDPAT